MALTTANAISFIPTRNPEAARTFYEQTLGLGFEADDGFALIFRAGPPPGSMLRVVRVRDLTAQSHTVFGWKVEDIAASVDELVERGVRFERYTPLPT